MCRSIGHSLLTWTTSLYYKGRLQKPTAGFYYFKQWQPSGTGWNRQSTSGWVLKSPLNWTSQEHQNLSTWLYTAQVNMLWIVGTPTIIIIPAIIQNVRTQLGWLILNRLHPMVNTDCSIGQQSPLSDVSHMIMMVVFATLEETHV